MDQTHTRFLRKVLSKQNKNETWRICVDWIAVNATAPFGAARYQRLLNFKRYMDMDTVSGHARNERFSENFSGTAYQKLTDVIN